MHVAEQLETSQRQKWYTWSHGTSHIFACFSCTVGMYSINRFGYLVYIYRGPFLVQFLILSIILGIPFYFLVMALGNSIGRVKADLWDISPAFKGLGVALLYLNIIIGTYSSLPLSWLLRYFCDSFITVNESYKWSNCNYSLLRDECNQNWSYVDAIGNAVPSYLHLNILQRKPNTFAVANLQSESIFTLAIIWFIVFVCLCYGLKFYGKIVFLLSLIPLVLLLLILIRFMDEWSQGIHYIFNSPWSVYMRDSWSWLLAGREVVMIWILLSDVTLQICSYNKQEIPIAKSFVIVTILTLYALVASSFLFCCGIEALKTHHAVYFHSSYEDITSIRILEQINVSRSKHIQIVNLWIGENSVNLSENKKSSGYQPIRFSTELIPTVFALQGPRQLSPVWAVSFYGMLLLLGFGQQVSIWWCVVNSIITANPKLLRKWETFITFGSCLFGFGLSLPMAANVGISLIYYLDCCIGSLWWILFLFMIMLVAIIFIEGEPYDLEQIYHSIAKNAVMKKLILPILIVLWNVILPLAYLVMSIIFLRASQYEMNFPWTRGRTSWSQWTRYFGVIIQIFPLVIVISICLTQLYLYLRRRPEGSENERDETCCCCLGSGSAASRRNTEPSFSLGQEDTPPKYTPPPSYSTATSRAVRNVLRRVSTSIEVATISITASSLPDLVSYTESSTQI